MQMGDDDVLDGSAATPKFASASTGLSVSLRPRAFASSALNRYRPGCRGHRPGSAKRNNRGPAPWSHGDPAPGNSNGGYAATSSHSAARRFRRHFPSVSLLFCGGVGRSAQQAIVIRKGQTRDRMTAAWTGSRSLCETDHIARLRAAGSRKARPGREVRRQWQRQASAPSGHSERNLFRRTGINFVAINCRNLRRLRKRLTASRAWFDNANP